MQKATEKIIRNAGVALVVWADDTVGEMKAEILRVKAFDTGELFGSVTRTPPRFQGKVLKIIFFTPKEYAAIIEFGRAAGGKPPPLYALVGWAKRKRFVTSLPVSPSFTGDLKKKIGIAKMIRRNALKKTGGQKKARKTKQLLDPQVRDFLVLLGIQEAIARRGIKGRRPLTTAFERRKRTFTQDIAKLMKSMP